MNSFFSLCHKRTKACSWSAGSIISPCVICAGRLTGNGRNNSAAFIFSLFFFFLMVWLILSPCTLALCWVQRIETNCILIPSDPPSCVLMQQQHPEKQLKWASLWGLRGFLYYHQPFYSPTCVLLASLKQHKVLEDAPRSGTFRSVLHRGQEKDSICQ